MVIHLIVKVLLDWKPVRAGMRHLVPIYLFGNKSGMVQLRAGLIRMEAGPANGDLSPWSQQVYENVIELRRHQSFRRDIWELPEERGGKGWGGNRAEEGEERKKNVLSTEGKCSGPVEHTVWSCQRLQQSVRCLGGLEVGKVSLCLLVQELTTGTVKNCGKRHWRTRESVISGRNWPWDKISNEDIRQKCWRKETQCEGCKQRHWTLQRCRETQWPLMNSTELADNEGHLNVLMTFSPSGPFHSPLQVNWHVCCVCTAELVSGWFCIESPCSPPCLAQTRFMLVVLSEGVMTSHFTVKDVQVWKIKYTVGYHTFVFFWASGLATEIWFTDYSICNLKEITPSLFFPQEYLIIISISACDVAKEKLDEALPRGPLLCGHLTVNSQRRGNTLVKYLVGT